jgi:activator of HSP90 ATPase
MAGVYAWGTGDDVMVEEESEAEPARGKEKQSLTTSDAEAQQDSSEQSKGEVSKVCFSYLA